MNICQLTIFCMLINGMFNIERGDSVNKKLQKSFVEIFGEGWDEEERTEEIGKMAGDWQNDDKQIGKNDQRETMTAIGGDQMKQQQETSSGARNNDQDNQKNEKNDGEDEKREIICKWYAIKAKIKQRKGKQSTNEWKKVEKLLAKKLDTSLRTLYRWIKKMGMKQRKMQTNDEKLALMRQYWEMKRNDPKIGDRKIAKALEISRESIRKWKGQFGKELGMKMMKQQLNVITDEQKRAIVREFQIIKERMRKKEQKYSAKQWNKMEILLAKKLGTYRNKIYEWMREFGMGQRKKQTNEGKLALMRKYWEMKRNDPKMSDAKIAKALKISERSIRIWKCQFREELGMEKQKEQTIVVLDERKREIIRKWYAIKERIKQRKGKQSHKEWHKIEKLLAKKLDTNRSKIYEWIRELGA